MVLLTLVQMKLQKVVVFVHSFREAEKKLASIFWRKVFGIHFLILIFRNNFFLEFFYSDLENIFVNIPVVDIV